MKRLSVFLLLMLVSTYHAAGDGRRAFFEELLPGRPVAVLSAGNIAALMQNLEQTSLGMGRELNLPLDRWLRHLQFFSALATGLPAGEQHALLQGGCAVALLESSEGSLHLPVALALDLSHLPAEARRTFEKTLTSALRLVLYGAARLHNLGDGAYRLEMGPTPDQQFRIIFRNSGVIVGFDSDLGGKSRPAGLPDDPSFRSLISVLPIGTDLSGYVDIQRLLAELQRRYPDDGRQAAFDLLGLTAIKAIAVHSAARNGLLEDKLFVATGGQHQEPGLDAQPSNLEGARFVPPHFGLFAAADIGHGEQIYERLRSLLRLAGGEASVARFDLAAALFDQLGMSVSDDLCASISGEIFVAADINRLAEVLIDGIDARKTPYLIGWRVDDNLAFTESITRLLDSPHLQEALEIRRATIRSAEGTFVHITSTIEERLDAAYAFIGGYFIYSPLRSTLEDALRAFRTGANLLSQPTSSSLRSGLQSECNVQAYVQTAVLYRELLKAYEGNLDEATANLVRMFVEDADRAKSGCSIMTAALRHDGLLVELRSPMGIWIGGYTASEFIRIMAARGDD